VPSLPTLLRFALADPRPAPPPRPAAGPGAKYRQPDRQLDYGAHPLQQIDFHSAGAGKRPLLAFLHGGAWQFGDKARRLKDRKAPFAHGEGWHFASINFRMVPEVSVSEMARDVAKAIRHLFDRADMLGIDTTHIALMGHSSGAHLAALVGSDPAYLRGEGLEPGALAGVIANEGAAYDARERSVGPGWLHRRLIAPAFPGDPDALAALSPVLHAASAPNAPAFLILHTAHCFGVRHAEALEASLRHAGTPVERHAFAGRGTAAHVMMSRKFGEPGFPPTEVARRWLAERFT